MDVFYELVFYLTASQLFLENIENKKFLNEFKRTKGKLISENKVEFSDIDAYDINFGISDIVKQKAKNIK